jgi:hypothetical protein
MLIVFAHQLIKPFKLKNRIMKTMKRKTTNISAFLFLLCFLPTLRLSAEGTGSVSPNSSTLCALGLLPDQVRGSFLGCPADQRIKIRINDHSTENIYYGFSWRLYQSNLSSVNPTIDNMYIRIFDPTGAQVGTQINLPETGAGFINTFAQGQIGANISGSHPGGYSPLSFNPTMNGEYHIEVYQGNGTGSAQLAGNTWSLSPYWDVQVATTAGVRKNGRLNCRKWAFVAVHPSFYSADFSADAAPSIYAWSADSTILKLDFSTDFKPIAFDVAVTRYGVEDNGNWIVDRKSKNKATSPLYPGGYQLFLNYPDTNIYAVAPLPPNPILSQPVITNCTSPFIIRYSIYAAGDVRVFLDLNGTVGYQAGTADRVLEQLDAVAGLNTMSWDGLDGLGATVPTGLSFKIYVQYLKGRFNLPLYDAEVNKNGFNISTIAPINDPNIRVYWDDSDLPNLGGVCAANADNQNNITGAGVNNTFLGAVSPCHAWSGNGNPTQAIPAPSVGTNESLGFQCDDFGNVRAINTFGWAVSSLDSAIVQLGCLTASGTVWNDVNGSANGTNNNIFTAGENGTNTSNSMFAVLVDPATGEALENFSVGAAGTYNFVKVPTFTTGLIVRLTSTSATLGSTAPAVFTVPAGWANTSPLTQTFNTVAANVTGLDFGLEELPTPGNLTAPSQTNPGGTTSVPVPPATFSGTDPNGGSITSLRVTAFPTNTTSITINGTNYTSGTFPGAGVSVPTNASGEPTQAILIDPINGSVSAVIPYRVTDNANKEGSTAGSATMPFVNLVSYSLSGNVFNDINGLTDNTVNGSGLGNPAGTTLHANLISAGNVSQTIPVNANGTYSFSGVSAGSFTVQISTNAGTVGQPTPVTLLPTGWVHTGEFVGTSAGNDGTANGNLSFTVSANLTDINFGIQEACAANAGTITKP